MKKFIGASVALLALTSCGAPTIEGPADALQKNQSALIENVEKLHKMTPEQAKSVWTITFNASAKEGSAQWNVSYDFLGNQTTYEASWNLAIDVSLESADTAMASMNMSGNLDLDLITLKNKILFKLNSLNINGADQNPTLALISGFAAPFQNNWYFVDNAAQSPMMEIQQELLTKQKDIVQLMKKHILLSHVSTNENADYYDYEVQLNQESIVNFMKDLEALGQTEENSESLLTQTEIDNITKAVNNFNTEIKGNIKIDKSNLEYFILTFSHSDGSLVIENSKMNFNITMNDTIEKITLSFLGTKAKTKFDALIKVVAQKSETETINLVDGKMNITTDGKKSDINLELVVKDEFTNDDLKLNVTMSDTTTAETVTIEEPSDAKDFEEVVTQMRGGMMWAPVPMETQIDNTHMNLDIQTEDTDTTIPETEVQING